MSGVSDHWFAYRPRGVCGRRLAYGTFRSLDPPHLCACDLVAMERVPVSGLTGCSFCMFAFVHRSLADLQMMPLDLSCPCMAWLTVSGAVFRAFPLGSFPGPVTPRRKPLRAPVGRSVWIVVVTVVTPVESSYRARSFTRSVHA